MNKAQREELVQELFGDRADSLANEALDAAGEAKGASPGSLSPLDDFKTVQSIRDSVNLQLIAEALESLVVVAAKMLPVLDKIAASQQAAWPAPVTGQ